MATPTKPRTGATKTQTTTTPPTTAGSARRWLTVAEVCDHTGIARRTLYDWWSHGVGPRRTRLPNAQVRVRADWLEDWLLGLEDNLASGGSAA